MKILKYLLFFLFLFTMGYVTYVKTQTTYFVGYMYWYHPTILQEKWELVVTATVTSTQEKKLKINELIHQERYDAVSKKELEIFDHDFLTISGGFNGLKKSDKILLCLTIYEGAYSIASFRGTQTNFGLKLKSFHDPIIGAIERFIKLKPGEKPSQKDIELWRKYTKNVSILSTN